MFDLVKSWCNKRKLCKALKSELNKLEEVNAFDLIEEDYGNKSYEDVLKEIEIFYLQKGLSQKDIDRVKKGINKMINIEGW